MSRFKVGQKVVCVSNDMGLDHVDGCRAAVIVVEEIIQDRFDIDKQSSWWAQVLELLKCPLV